MMGARELDEYFHARKNLQRGDVVEIGPAYRMGGTFEPDGHEGIYTVVRAMSDGRDYYLARGNVRPEHLDDHGWDLICHESRLEPVIRRI